MEVLTPNQDLLTDYLAALGMSVIQRLIILMDLWEPEATLEMLQHIAETEEKDPTQLLKVASRISKKYNQHDYKEN